MQIEEKIKKLTTLQAGMTIEKAHQLGRDCYLNGADTTNCHFGIFSKPEFTRAWEYGKRGEELK